VQLRSAVRARKDLLNHRVGLANQLRAHLRFFHPGPVGLFADLDAVTSLRFLGRFTSQDDTDWLTLLPARDLAALRRLHRPQGLHRAPRPPTRRRARRDRPSRRRVPPAGGGECGLTPLSEARPGPGSARPPEGAGPPGAGALNPTHDTPLPG
jgi:hypothetical protein